MRRARREHLCDACGGTVRKGEQYQVQAVSPWHEGNESDRWVHYRFHLAGACVWYQDTPPVVESLADLA